MCPPPAPADGGVIVMLLLRPRSTELVAVPNVPVKTTLYSAVNEIGGAPLATAIVVCELLNVDRLDVTNIGVASEPPVQVGAFVRFKVFPPVRIRSVEPPIVSDVSVSVVLDKLITNCWALEVCVATVTFPNVAPPSVIPRSATGVVAV